MRNEFFFQIGVTDEQVSLANQLVEYSIANHPVQDIFAKDPEGKERQREFRFTGTLGEIVFADAYNLAHSERLMGKILDRILFWILMENSSHLTSNQWVERIIHS